MLHRQGSRPPPRTPDIFYQVRKKIGDIKRPLPAGICGPFFNDEFGDVFGNIYASPATASTTPSWAAAETVRAELLRVPSVAKVDLIGEQEQRIYVISQQPAGHPGLDVQTVSEALARQNAVAPGGDWRPGRAHLPAPVGPTTPSRRSARRASGRRARAAHRRHRPGGAGFVEPPAPRFRFRAGRPRARRVDGQGRRHHRPGATQKRRRASRPSCRWAWNSARWPASPIRWYRR